MIDWIIVIAQIGNFLLLVFVLKYFFYGRVIAAMDERERKIVERWDDAGKKRDEAVARQNEYEAKLRELELQREQWNVQAKEEADEFRRRLMKQGRDETDSLVSRWQQSLAAEKEGFLRDVRIWIGQGACTLARRVLTDLADADLEAQIVRYFIEQFQNHPERDLCLPAGGDDATGPIVIRSAFALSAHLQKEIREMLASRLQHDREIEFQIAPELTCGIELLGNGRKIAWEIAQYVDSMEQQWTELLGDSALDEKASIVALAPQ